MKILLNGETREVPADSTAQDLVELLDLTGKRLAMEVNREILPRTRYQQYHLQNGDEVEIVHAIGGG